MSSPGTTVEIPSGPNRWVHRWAWALVCMTFPLIFVGGHVTTTDAGMAFPDWLTSDGTFMLVYPWLSSAGDKFLEHGHRLLGATVGFITIILLWVTYQTESHRSIRCYAWVLLAAVIGQGALGGLRILQNDRLVALIHGCTGPLFFGLCVTMLVITSKHWSQNNNPSLQKSKTSLSDETVNSPTLKRLFRIALFSVGLAYLQIILGAIVRHTPKMHYESADKVFNIAVIFHILIAIALCGHIMLLVIRCYKKNNCKRLAGGLGLLLLIQITLGLLTWFNKYGLPYWFANTFGEINYLNSAGTAFQNYLTTAHVAVGSLVFVLVLSILLLIGRSAKSAVLRPVKNQKLRVAL